MRGQWSFTGCRRLEGSEVSVEYALGAEHKARQRTETRRRLAVGKSWHVGGHERTWNILEKSHSGGSTANLSGGRHICFDGAHCN